MANNILLKNFFFFQNLFINNDIIQAHHHSDAYTTVSPVNRYTGCQAVLQYDFSKHRVDWDAVHAV